MKYLIEKIYRRESLTAEESYSLMQSICSFAGNDRQISAVLAVLHYRGETSEEILGFIRFIKQKSIKIDIGKIDAIDICGTGGDSSGTFNISTATALVLASANMKVVKHGGRASSSQCGSVDVLSALGIPLYQLHSDIINHIDKFNCVFLQASSFNPVFKQVASLRKEIGVRTCFNLLGPLLNPANPKYRIIGVYAKKLLMPVVQTLKRLGVTDAMVVHSQDGLDEFSVFAPTDVLHLRAGKISCYEVNPQDFGLFHRESDDIKGGTSEENANIIRQIISGEKGAKRDVVLINAAAGLVLSGKASSFKEGVAIAQTCIDTGMTKTLLEKLNQEKYHEK